jgi:hypothetical protein
MAPMGIGATQPRWRGDGGGLGGMRHPAHYYAGYAGAPKSVIDLKVPAKPPDYPFREPLTPAERCPVRGADGVR